MWLGVGSIIASAARSAEIDFERDVLPILREHCIDCHSQQTSESDLRLDSAVGALRGGDSGESVIVPGNSQRSYLIERLTSKGSSRRMPPDEDPISDEKIQLLRSWIDDAEQWKPARQELASQSSRHWSFQPLERPAVPDALGVNPIDAFVRAKLADAGLSVSERASRRRLIRRLYLVMHGLPPSPEQVTAFINDPRPRAWELLVDDVLNSPQYGERWAAHWLDLVRFGETHGFETNRERPHAWPYRDWVIDAWNDDKPYDDFIVEQIAGDGHAEDAATGFLVAGPYDLVKGQDPQLSLIQRQDELADIINTTGTAFLGLTLGCARCHNHKFDPISHTDYYAMQAVFAGVNHADRALPLAPAVKEEIASLEREISELKQSLATFIRKESDAGLRPAVNAKLNVESFAAVTGRLVRFSIDETYGSEPCIDELEIFSGDENVGLANAGAKPSSSGDFVHPLHELEQINDGQYGNARSWICAQRSGGWVQIELPEERKIDRIEWGRDREGRYKDRLATKYRIEVSTDGEAWRTIADSTDRQPHRAGSKPKIIYDFDAFGKTEADRGRRELARHEELSKKLEAISTPRMIYAGTFSQPGPTHRLYRGEPNAPREEVVPAAIGSLSNLTLAADTPEQHRRRAIAGWIADKENPLTARVMVNRLWQHHFGTGIVDTPSDFGGNGTGPSHPLLLDWLAAEFIESGWSIKYIQRLILTCETWQQDSRPRTAPMAVDADSRLLWRFPPRRLEAEGIRDCMLAVAGKLNPQMGGPGFSAFEIENENVRHYFPKQNYGPDDWRRMIYMTKVRQERDAVFGVFDCPDCNQVVPKRSRSTTPLQALNLLNSPFVMQQANLFAARLEQEAETTDERIVWAYERCFSRRPDADEVESAEKFIRATDLQQFARAMLNANEFVFIP